VRLARSARVEAEYITSYTGPSLPAALDAGGVVLSFLARIWFWTTSQTRLPSAVPTSGAARGTIRATSVSTTLGAGCPEGDVVGDGTDGADGADGTGPRSRGLSRGGS
jgi:hypothetical protein